MKGVVTMEGVVIMKRVVTIKGSYQLSTLRKNLEKT
jgi:hypothetical protein